MGLEYHPPESAQGIVSGWRQVGSTGIQYRRSSSFQSFWNLVSYRYQDAACDMPYVVLQDNDRREVEEEIRKGEEVELEVQGTNSLE